MKIVQLDSSKQALNVNEKKSAQNGVFLHMSQLDIDNVNKGDRIEYNLVFNNDLNKPQAFKAKRISRK